MHDPPYLFEAFLFQPVDDLGSSARVSDSAVLLRLLKKTPEPWEDLLADAGTHGRNVQASQKSRGHLEAAAAAPRSFHQRVLQAHHPTSSG